VTVRHGLGLPGPGTLPPAGQEQTDSEVGHRITRIFMSRTTNKGPAPARAAVQVQVQRSAAVQVQGQLGGSSWPVCTGPALPESHGRHLACDLTIASMSQYVLLR
jgi:hypothetical protein